MEENKEDLLNMVENIKKDIEKDKEDYMQSIIDDFKKDSVDDELLKIFDEFTGRNLFKAMHVLDIALMAIDSAKLAINEHIETIEKMIDESSSTITDSSTKVFTVDRDRFEALMYIEEIVIAFRKKYEVKKYKHFLISCDVIRETIDSYTNTAKFVALPETLKSFRCAIKLAKRIAKI